MIMLRRGSPVSARRRVLLLDREALEPLTRLAAPFEAQALDWAGLTQAVQSAAPSSVVVVDPLARPGSPELDSRLPALLAAARMVPVVALVPFDAAHAASARALLDQGVTELADAQFEQTPDAIRLRLLAVHAQPLKKAVEASLSRFVSIDGLTLIRAAAEVAVDGGSAVELGRIFDSRERTVAGWCAREGLPTPRRLLAWLRLMLALALLEDPRRSVQNAAACAGYTDYSLRRALGDFLGGRVPTRRRTLRDALDGFNAELRDLRERARQERRGKDAA